MAEYNSWISPNLPCRERDPLHKGMMRPSLVSVKLLAEVNGQAEEGAERDGGRRRGLFVRGFREGSYIGIQYLSDSMITSYSVHLITILLFS